MGVHGVGTWYWHTLLNIYVVFYYKNVILVKQESFQKLLLKQEGTRAEWEYPFAVAGINISFMLIQMLDLQSSMFSWNILLLCNNEMHYDFFFSEVWILY